MIGQPELARAPVATRRWPAVPACGPGIEMVPDDSEGIRLAKKVCGDCPVRAACLTAATSLGEPDGVWGGLTRDERYRRHAATAAGVADPRWWCVRCGLPCMPAGAAVVCDECDTEPAASGVDVYRAQITVQLATGRSLRQVAADVGVPLGVLRGACRRWSVRSRLGKRPADDELLPCGTPAARRRHERRGEPVCAACKAANRRATAAIRCRGTGQRPSRSTSARRDSVTTTNQPPHVHASAAQSASGDLRRAP